VSESLDLTNVFDRDTVKLPGGTEYEIRNPEEFSILEEHQLNNLLKRIDVARGKAQTDDTEEAAKQASELLRELATLLIVDLKEEVTDWACVAVFRFWTERISAAAEKANPPKPRGRTTGKSSRGSKRSTAATRKAGSNSRRTR
jgi:hypothetical protein